MVVCNKLDPSAVGQLQGKCVSLPNNTSTIIPNDQPLLLFSSTTSTVNKTAAVALVFYTLHARLVHTSLLKMKHIAECKSHISNPFFCEICVLAKSHRLPFHRSSISTHSPFELVQMDLWGPYRTANIIGAYFFSHFS